MQNISSEKEKIEMEIAQRKINRKIIIKGGFEIGLSLLFITAFALVCVYYKYFFIDWIKTALAIFFSFLVLVVLFCLAYVYFAMGMILLLPYIKKAEQEAKNQVL